MDTIEKELQATKYQDLKKKFDELGIEDTFKPGVKKAEMISQAIEKLNDLKDTEKEEKKEEAKAEGKEVKEIKATKKQLENNIRTIKLLLFTAQGEKRQKLLTKLREYEALVK